MILLPIAACTMLALAHATDVLVLEPCHMTRRLACWPHGVSDHHFDAFVFWDPDSLRVCYHTPVRFHLPLWAMPGTIEYIQGVPPPGFHITLFKRSW